MNISVISVVPLVAASLVLQAFGASQQIGVHRFTLPDGFTIEKVADSPLVDRPIVADFDEQGRLYVADSSGSNADVRTQLEEKPHRIMRLEDRDGDGVFDTSLVFADRMMFPEGAMWYEGSLYVGAPPSIWKLTDTDNDGVADVREEWFQGKTLTGCANDLHGPYAGPDGWIYWCKGAFAEQTYPRPGKAPWTTRAAHIFRCRPDGSGLEAVMTGGMDNPVEVVFTPEGERIFSTTFFQHPRGGKRDGLVHAIYGGVYGKIHDVIESHPRTGEVMPVLTNLGAAAPCGLLRYNSNGFGEEYRSNVFTALFNLHKITRHQLTPEGATFRSYDSDFLVSDQTDFHPTDVLQDADGSLLVVDTGGWYKLCCPTSQLHKPDVLGAIYRIRRTDSKPLEDPWGNRMDWSGIAPAQLTELLADPRPNVRKRAANWLVRKSVKSVPVLAAALRGNSNMDLRRRAVWTLCRIDAVSARVASRVALSDSDESVCRVAAHAVSVHRDEGSLSLILDLLKSSSPAMSRVAAEALGRLGGAVSSIPAILNAASETTERTLQHSLIYALIELDDFDATMKSFATLTVRSQSAALMAMDQMESSRLGPEFVASHLDSSDASTKEAAYWIISRHPEWARSLVGIFEKTLEATDQNPSGREQLVEQLAQFAGSGDEFFHQLLNRKLIDPAASLAIRRTVLKAMGGSKVNPAPDAWVSSLARLIKVNDLSVIDEALSAVQSLEISEEQGGALSSALTHIAGEASQSVSRRLAAMAALPGGVREVDPNLFKLLSVESLADKPVQTRITAARILSDADLSDRQYRKLIHLLPSYGPLELPQILKGFAKIKSRDVVLDLMKQLHRDAEDSSLHAQTLHPLIESFPDDLKEDGQVLLALYQEDIEEKRKHLDRLLPLMKSGDIRRGQKIFNSARTACVSCHEIGYLGGDVGPDLTSIGKVRNERDLLEAILYPSLSFVRSYEPMIIETRDDEFYSGVVRNEGPDSILLVTGPDTEVTVSKSEILDMRPGAVSIMPAGLDQQISTQELADLVAFLSATKWK